MTKSTITREHLQILIDTAKHIISRDNTSPYSENLREIARIALAAMDSEPVAWRDPFTGRCVSSIFYQDGSSPLDHGYEPLYSAPQEPVVTGKWIPVSEQMPEIRKGWLDTPVIIAVLGEKDGAEAMYCSDGKFRWGRDEQPINDVTHWMPLPAAPQEVK